MTGEALKTPVHSFTATPEDALVRLDVFITKKLPTFSRTFFKDLATRQAITINGKTVSKSSIMIKPNDTIQVTFPLAPELGTPKKIEGDLGVKVVFEHPQFLIIYKPAGLMCHAPQEDSPEITLVDWLLTYFKEISTVGSHDRPGIVHRLDKDTSGLMVIPRNNQAHHLFGEAFKNRLMHKTYHAVVQGQPELSGTINYPIDRHPRYKHKMTHVTEQNALRWRITGRESTTHYKVLEQFEDSALMELKPVTGRTHQIRVHCAAIGHGLLGDELYGIKSTLISRQALHAYALSFEFEGKEYSFTYDVPGDFKHLLEIKRKNQ